MVIPQERPVAEVMKEPPGVVITPVDPTIPPWYIEDGLRRVRPYFYTYNTYCKERWRGRSIFSIFAAEFRDRPEEYYVRERRHFHQILLPPHSSILKQNKRLV